MFALPTSHRHRKYRSAANQIPSKIVLREREGNKYWSFPFAMQRRKVIAKNYARLDTSICTTPICDERASTIYLLSSRSYSSDKIRGRPKWEYFVTKRNINTLNALACHSWVRTSPSTFSYEFSTNFSILPYIPCFHFCM